MHWPLGHSAEGFLLSSSFTLRSAGNVRELIGLWNRLGPCQGQALQLALWKRIAESWLQLEHECSFAQN